MVRARVLFGLLAFSCILLASLQAFGLAPIRWAEIETAVNEPDIGSCGFDVDEKGRLNFVWSEGTDAEETVYFKRTYAHLEVINKKDKIEDTSGVVWIGCASDHVGDLNLAYVDDDGLKYAKYSFNGILMTGPDTLDSGGVTNASIEVDGDRNTHIVYAADGALKYVRIDIFGDPDLGPKVLEGSSSSKPDIAVYGGLIHLAFQKWDQILYRRYDAGLELLSEVQTTQRDSIKGYPLVLIDNTEKFIIYPEEINSTTYLSMSRLDREDGLVLVERQLFQGAVLFDRPRGSIDSEGRLHLLWIEYAYDHKLVHCAVDENGLVLVSPLWITTMEKGLGSKAGSFYGFAMDDDDEMYVVWSKGKLEFITTKEISEDDPGLFGPNPTLRLGLVVLLAGILAFVNMVVLRTKKKDIENLVDRLPFDQK